MLANPAMGAVSRVSVHAGIDLPHIMVALIVAGAQGVFERSFGIERGPIGFDVIQHVVDICFDTVPLHRIRSVGKSAVVGIQ